MYHFDHYVLILHGFSIAIVFIQKLEDEASSCIDVLFGSLTNNTKFLALEFQM